MLIFFLPKKMECLVWEEDGCTENKISFSSFGSLSKKSLDDRERETFFFIFPTFPCFLTLCVNCGFCFVARRKKTAKVSCTKRGGRRKT